MVKLNKYADVVMTSRQGELYETYENLQRALGPAHNTDIDGKVNYEWVFDTPYGTATLHDYWWNGKDEWSIGGHSGEVVPLIQEFVSKRVADMTLEEDREEFLLVHGHSD